MLQRLDWRPRTLVDTSSHSPEHRQLSRMVKKEALDRKITENRIFKCFLTKMSMHIINKLVYVTESPLD